MKIEKMTLSGYYKNLPDRISPKWEFIREISEHCCVSIQTARNWVLYGMKPRNPEHVDYLSKVTGISADALWEE